MFQGKIVTSDGTIVVTVDNRSYTVTTEHPKYEELKDAVAKNDSKVFLENVEVAQAIEQYAGVATGIVIKNNEVFFNGERLHGMIVESILNMFKQGFCIEPMVNFLENLSDNPSKRSIDELWQFLEVCKLTITEDGCFLAYKSVKSDYCDKYTGSVDNSPGAYNSMPRNKVDDDFRNACSSGYHVGALGYAGPGGWYNSSNDKVVIVKVNPKDVVSVPSDHSCMKLRCCAYTVVSDFQGELKTSVYSGKVNDSYSPKNYQEPVMEPVEVDADNMLVDGEYEFDYYRDGEYKRRYLVVTENFLDRVIGMLLYPEANAGQYRCFSKCNMKDIYEYCTEGFVDEDEEDCDDNPW